MKTTGVESWNKQCGVVMTKCQQKAEAAERTGQMERQPREGTTERELEVQATKEIQKEKPVRRKGCCCR